VALAVPIELVQEQIHQVLWDVFAGELDTERVKRLRTLLNEQDLHLGREFTDAIEAELTARRFSVIRIASPFERADDGQNPPIQADADVILTFAVTAAFDSGIHIGHHPIVSISGEVIRASDRTLLDRIYAVYHPDDTLFGWYGPPTDGRQFIFRSFEEMLARPADVAYALRAGEQPLASNITHLLLNEPLEEWPRHQGVVVLWVAKAKQEVDRAMVGCVRRQVRSRLVSSFAR